MTDDMREKTITEVMRNPIVSYRVSGSFEGGEGKSSQSTSTRRSKRSMPRG